jgi:hypothetical protein
MSDLRIVDNHVMCGRQRLPVKLVPDARWPGMWRVWCPGAELSDMANRTRAVDAALFIAARLLRREQVGAAELRGE